MLLFSHSHSNDSFNNNLTTTCLVSAQEPATPRTLYLSVLYISDFNLVSKIEYLLCIASLSKNVNVNFEELFEFYERQFDEDSEDVVCL